MKLRDDAWRVAILDLYDGAENQGMRCLREMLQAYALREGLTLQVQTFDLRGKGEIPDTSFDVYIGTGGPGDPLASEGSPWEKNFFSLLEALVAINADPSRLQKKYAFFICHSFQLLCRHYRLGMVCRRKSPSYGVFPVHKWGLGFAEPVFCRLCDPFYAVDSREWQVIQPDEARFRETGATLLALEKERPHVPLERALMAVRFSPYFFGTQFHPEADAAGMRVYLQQEDKKEQVIRDHGAERYARMLEQLHDPEKILLTQREVIPAFLDAAIGKAQVYAL